jgi:N-acetylglucosaminyldiphosphoundecaprenol N-acetyl-beta-D-mannosaminyltransferase
MERKKIKILGFGVDTFDFNEAVSYTKHLMDNNIGAQIITVNPEMIELGLKDSGYSEILDDADLVLPDGVGIQLALKLKGHSIKRVTGIEFSHRLIEECSKSGYPIALIGAKEHVIKKAAENLKKEYPNLNISLMQNGYYDNVDDVYWSLGEKNPKLVLVALGAPKQEYFIAGYRKYHPDTVMIGVGGSFDVWAGEVQRAPEIYQKLGLEWLYRTIKQPERFKRIFPCLPRFLLRVITNNIN